jgi:pyruvate/2-oxoglutarate dehydrogenase complex dihydrolipoamide acyltransferase (E2) component
VISRLVVPVQMGENAEVRVLSWYKAEGDSIAAGDALVELETDKAIVLVTAQGPGVLRRCFAAAGDWLVTGQVAAWISDTPAEPLPSDREASLDDVPATFEVT